MMFTSGRMEYLISLFVLATHLCYAIEIRVPVNYTALTGDLEIHVQNVAPQDDPYYLQLLEFYPSDNSFKIIGSTVLCKNNSSLSLIYKAKFPCGLIAQGGRYGVRLRLNVDTDVNEVLTTMPNYEYGPMIEQSREKNYIAQLDVRWPPVSLLIEPREIETYPEFAVIASVAFLTQYCEPSIGSLVPETWISLIYCGHSQIECKLENISHQVLYSEQIRGYVSLRNVQLNCNLFGHAGYYTLFLTTGMHGTGTPIATLPANNVLKAKWSERFVFNVHTRSIFQCDAQGGGVAVLFQYPDCILPNDKIRLFGSLRADVASSLSPTSLHYIVEQKVIKGKYSLHFDCDLFSEKYVEYCFVYVSQAITGAVADVRMDCVPTFPVSENDAGQWGSWSEWSECSSTCRGGTRNRYRFCDSPSPKYGAKYCEGHTVETEPCGNGSSWECQLYDIQIVPELLVEKPEIQEVVGEKCRCGCIIHLNANMPQRFLAASLRNCSRKAWWKIQADPGHTVQLYMNRVHFPCAMQKLKIHDGEYFSSNLLAQFTSTDSVSLKNFSVMSSASVLLLEYSISDILNNVECAGGFLSHFRQKAVNTSTLIRFHVESMSAEMPVEAVHLAILIILVTVVFMSSVMMIQYINRYNKYQRASINDSLADSEYSECFSRQNFTAVISHETSTSTLISEIIPLRKLRKDGKYSKDEQLDTNSERVIFSHCSQYSSSYSAAEFISRNSCLCSANDFASKELETQNYSDMHCKSQQHVFKAEVHVENEPDDNSNSNKSPVSTENAVTEPIRSSISFIRDEAERRPSCVCTRVSVSSSVSPTLSCNTNVAPSPNSSLRGVTLKRVKDIRNKERVMVDSDFSLAGHDTDLEMDYYDYNVYNTNTVPGSYLGMDPAYCVWIPPYAPGQWTDNGSEEDNSCSTYDDIEMQILKSKSSINEVNSSRSHTPPPHSEKFQKECKSSEKENFKRLSSVSTASSCNKTIVQDDIIHDDDLAIREALLPDSPLLIQQAFVKDAELAIKIPSLEKDDDFKYADDDDDSDIAYNSDNGDDVKMCVKVTDQTTVQHSW